MNSYQVVFPVWGGPASPALLELNFPEKDGVVNTVYVKQLNRIIGTKTITEGFYFDVKVWADTEDDAIEKATGLADGVASFISMVCGIGLPIIKAEICIETTEGKNERDFIQFFDGLPIQGLSRRNITPQDLFDSIDGYYKVEDKIKERIGRAGRWYRYGTSTTDIFDKFVSYWMGLESINTLLQDRLNVGNDVVSCPRCGYKREVPSVSGIREFIRKYYQNEKGLYQRMRKLRVGIMHGASRLSNIIKEAEQIAPKSGNVLLGAIYFLLNFDQPWKQHDQTLSSAVPYRLAIEATILSNTIEEAYIDGRYPYFVASHNLIDVTQTTNSGFTSKLETEFKAVIGSNAKFKGYAIRSYGEGKGTLEINNVK